MDAEDLTTVLARFHGQVLLPDVERVVSGAVTGSETRLRDEMHAGFDAIAQRLDRLETEYHMLVAGLRPVEERLMGSRNSSTGWLSKQNSRNSRPASASCSSGSSISKRAFRETN